MTNRTGSNRQKPAAKPAETGTGKNRLTENRSGPDRLNLTSHLNRDGTKGCKNLKIATVLPAANVTFGGHETGTNCKSDLTPVNRDRSQPVKNDITPRTAPDR